MRFILNLFLTAIFSIGILSNGIAHAASITISYSDNNSFVVTGNGLAGVHAMDITIDYDSSVLSNPRIVAGFLSKDAMFAANPNIRGRILIGLATNSPISGDGTLATISFDNNGSGVGKIRALSVEASDVSGKPLSVSKVIGAQPEPQSPVAEQGSTGQVISPTQQVIRVENNPNPSSSTGAQPAPTGSVVQVPAGESEKTQTSPVLAPESHPAEPSSTGQQDKGTEPDNAAIAAANTVPEEKASWNPPVTKSILNRFRDFQGEKTPKNLLGLFSEGKSTVFRQEPPIVFSDGSSQVSVHIAIPSARQAPNFSLRGAKLVSLNPNGEQDWSCTITPDQNVVEATITVLFEGNSLDVPVIVAPAVPDMLTKKNILNEAAFALFLKERGTEQVPIGDLNNDGHRDYVDDYIYACNYLFLTAPSPEK